MGIWEQWQASQHYKDGKNGDDREQNLIKKRFFAI